MLIEEKNSVEKNIELENMQEMLSYESYFERLAFQVGRETSIDLDDLKQEYRLLFLQLKEKSKDKNVENFDFYFKSALRNKNVDIIRNRQKETIEKKEMLSQVLRHPDKLEYTFSMGESISEKSFLETCLYNGEIDRALELVEKKGRTPLQQYYEAFKFLGFSHESINTFLKQFMEEREMVPHNCYLCNTVSNPVFFIYENFFCKKCLKEAFQILKKFNIFKNIQESENSISEKKNKIEDSSENMGKVFSIKEASLYLGQKPTPKNILLLKTAIEEHPQIFKKTTKKNSWRIQEIELEEYKKILKIKSEDTSKENLENKKVHSYKALIHKDWMSLSEAAIFTGLSKRRIKRLYEDGVLLSENPPSQVRKYNKKLLENYKKEIKIPLHLSQMQLISEFIDISKFKEKFEGKTELEISKDIGLPLEVVKIFLSQLYKSDPVSKKIFTTDIGIGTDTEEAFASLPFTEAFFLLRKCLKNEYVKIWEEYFYLLFFTKELDEIVSGISLKSFEEKEKIIDFLVEKVEYTELATVVVKMHLVNLLYAGMFSR